MAPLSDIMDLMMKQLFSDLIESGAIVWVAISVSLFVYAIAQF